MKSKEQADLLSVTCEFEEKIKAFVYIRECQENFSRIEIIVDKSLTDSGINQVIVNTTENSTEHLMVKHLLLSAKLCASFLDFTVLLHCIHF